VTTNLKTISDCQVLLARAPNDNVLHESGAVTQDGETSAFDIGGYLHGWLVVDVTDMSGVAPTMDLELQGYNGLSGKWFAVPGLTIAQITEIGQTVYVTPELICQKVRLVWTIGGDQPSVTFSANLQVKS